MPLSANINTDKNENYPFVPADGITIYFASEGHESLGGYDISCRFNTYQRLFATPKCRMPFIPVQDYCLIIDEMSMLAGLLPTVTKRGYSDNLSICSQFRASDFAR